MSDFHNHKQNFLDYFDKTPYKTKLNTLIERFNKCYPIERIHIKEIIHFIKLNEMIEGIDYELHMEIGIITSKGIIVLKHEYIELQNVRNINYKELDKLYKMLFLNIIHRVPDFLSKNI